MYTFNLNSFCGVRRHIKLADSLFTDQLFSMFVKKHNGARKPIKYVEK